MNKKIIQIMMLAGTVLCLTACGRKQVQNTELLTFQNEMNAFCEKVSIIDAGMNSIDTEKDAYKEELLGYLDQLEEAFAGLERISIPAEYSYMQELTTDASSYMSTAVAAYHEAYSGDSYNEYTAAYALENYQRAYKRITVILQLLRGEEVTAADVTIETAVE